MILFIGKNRREAAQAKESTQESTNSIKTTIYGTIDTITSVVDGVVTVAKTVPKAIEIVQNLPTAIRQTQIETNRKITRAKQSVDDFLAWRPLDDAQRTIVSAQRDVNEKIEGVKTLSSKVKSMVDPPPPPPPTPPPTQPSSLLPSVQDAKLSVGENLKSSNVYNAGKNLVDKIAERNEATFERLERERLWRIANGYEDEATSIPVGGLKQKEAIDSEKSQFKPKVLTSNLFIGDDKKKFEQQEENDEDVNETVSTSILDNNGNTDDDNDDNNLPPQPSSPSVSPLSPPPKPSPGPKRKYNPF